MKYNRLILFIFLILNFVIHSQQSKDSSASSGSVIIASNDPLSLYRGYMHKISVGYIDQCDFPLFVNCSNCDTLYMDDNSNVIVVPGVSKSTVLYVYDSSDSTNHELITSKEFNVKSLPDPTNYIGAVKDGGNVYYKESVIFAKYPPEIWMNEFFEVLKWEIKIGRKTYRGEGNQVSPEVSDRIRKLKTGKPIELQTLVTSPSTGMRTVNSTFYRCPNEWYEGPDLIPLVDEYGNEIKQ